MYRLRSSGEAATAAEQPAQFSLCEVFPKTGRTHQIRAHFSHAGFPLVGDVKYGGLAVGVCSEDRLFLHSARLSFDDMGGDRHAIGSELPVELRAVLQGLEKQPGPE